ncbi:hypothetical protein KZX46_13425 [Polymorphobacter sp. PAMC 29334]|uniref:hypothetical protein n=1 Tax=Polymorphobacter sp. PAMC 29334 TaxID=2862331 RepID=UPI001C765AA3|nr:hypothetical protein [Polymorphobacter sp. PAMC 29334]QYE33829.1 hypothetical protein KZX46_13425 [Polymorphobacter sp. PAMC 29334]
MRNDKAACWSVGEHDDSGDRLRYWPLVFVIRRCLTRRYIAGLILAVTLLTKLLVPSGYMIASDQGRITITICSGVASQTMTMDMPVMHANVPGHGKPDHGKAEMPCAFSGLSAHALGAVDPILIVALIAFIMAIGLAPTLLPALSNHTYLRPPPTGPPATL